jgi:hypothetical protein
MRPHHFAEWNISQNGKSVFGDLSLHIIAEAHIVLRIVDGLDEM